MLNNKKTRKTILLVENEISIAMTEKKHLENLGYAVHSVTSAEKAISAILDSNITIDLILMDIDPGSAIDGAEVAAKILEIKSLPVVFLSSHAEPEIVEKTEKITSYGYVVRNSGITVLDASIKMAFKLFEAHMKEKEQRDALTKSEEQYHHIFSSAIEGIFQTTPAGRCWVINPAFSRMFGYGSPEEMKKTVTNIGEQHYVNQEDRLRLIELMSSTEGMIRDFEVHLKRKDGSTFWVSINARLVMDHEDGTSLIEGTCMDITDRRIAEETLREKELKYRNLFDNSVLGLYRSKIDGSEILEVNQALCDIFQCTVEEMKSQPAMIRWADPEARRDMINRLVKDNTLIGYEAGFVRKNGEIRNCLISVRLYPQEGYLEGTTIDITDRRRAENDLLLERDIAQTYLEVAGVMFIALDREGTVTLVNRKGCEILGLGREEIIGRNWFESFIPGYMVKDVRRVFDRIITGELAPVASFDNPIINAAGTERLIAWKNTILYDRKGRISGTLSSGEDITERKEAELALAESEKQYRLLFEQNKDLIFIQNIEGKTITVNPQACMTLGYTYDELVQIPLQRIDTPEQTEYIPERISNLIKHGFVNFETELLTRDGVVVPVDAHAVKIEWEGKPAIFSIGRDITVSRAAEEKINTLLREKEMILKEVHHRIKNNMNTIKSLLLMQSDSMNNQEAAEALKEASARVQSMAILYDRLYRSNNLGEIKLYDYMEPLIKEVVSLFPVTAAIKIENRFDDLNLPANTLVTLGIIINELITNAMKYAFTGRKTGVLRVSAVNTDRHTRLTVEDDGIGMPEDFDIDSSTGFGLILVKSLCRHIDAQLSIIGQPGTKVIIEFQT